MRKQAWQKLLMRAALDGNVEDVERALANGADVDNMRAFLGDEPRTALMLASQNGFLPVVTTLLAAGADPSTRNPQGWSALGCAIRCGHTEVVETLIAAGARLDRVDNLGNSAVKSAMSSQWIRTRQVGLLALLRKAEKDANALVDGASSA